MALITKKLLPGLVSLFSAVRVQSVQFSAVNYLFANRLLMGGALGANYLTEIFHGN